MVSELKELTSALTTPEMQKEIQELKKECAGYTERLKNINAATNHVTPEEKEQVYRERQRYCKEWRKRKRMVSVWELQAGPEKWQPPEKQLPPITDLSGSAEYFPSEKEWFCFLAGNRAV